MKTKLNLLIAVLFTVTAMACQNGNEDTPNGGNGLPPSSGTKLSFTFTDDTGIPIVNAFCSLEANVENRAIKVQDGYTSNTGVFQVEFDHLEYFIRGNLASDVLVNKIVDGYLTIVHPDYEPEKIATRILGRSPENISIKLKPKNSIGILSYNLLEGMKNITDKNEFYKWIEPYNADIVFYQELNGYTQEKLNALAKNYGHNYSEILKTTGYPTGITSKYPLTDVIKKFDGLHHGYIRALCNGIYLYAIHLSPSDVEKRISEIRIIQADIAGLPAGAKVIIAGDFNSQNAYDEVAYSKWAQEYNGTPAVFDYRATNLMGTTHKDAYTLCNSWFKATYKAEETVTSRARKGYRLDYIFVDKESAKNCTYCDILQNGFTHRASDHYPVYLRIKQ